MGSSLNLHVPEVFGAKTPIFVAATGLVAVMKGNIVRRNPESKSKPIIGSVSAMSGNTTRVGITMPA